MNTKVLINTDENRMVSLQDRINDMTDAELACLKALHALMKEVKAEPRTEKYNPVQFIEDIEYTMQGVWGFSRDRDFHTHWIDLKGCTCPKIDNRERMGSPYKITALDCPWHAPENPF